MAKRQRFDGYLSASEAKAIADIFSKALARTSQASLEKVSQILTAGGSTKAGGPKKKRKLSKKHLAAIRKGQKARWAKAKAAKV